MQPEEDVLSSNAEASTVTFVRSAASTRSGVQEAMIADGVVVCVDIRHGGHLPVGAEIVCTATWWSKYATHCVSAP